MASGRMAAATMAAGRTRRRVCRVWSSTSRTCRRVRRGMRSRPACLHRDAIRLVTAGYSVSRMLGTGISCGMRSRWAVGSGWGSLRVVPSSGLPCSMSACRPLLCSVRSRSICRSCAVLLCTVRTGSVYRSRAMLLYRVGGTSVFSSRAVLLSASEARHRHLFRLPMIISEMLGGILMRS
jgi:hypothetical protein